MLAIARALMTNPRLLILDEATEGLAPLVRAEIWRCLGRLKESGLSILVIDKNVGALIRVEGLFAGARCGSGFATPLFGRLSLFRRLQRWCPPTDEGNVCAT
jgi:ABC-type antimicrobial peptide transport system ATPase subunit